MLHSNKNNLFKLFISAVLCVTVLCSCSQDTSGNTEDISNSDTASVTSVSEQTDESNAETDLPETETAPEQTDPAEYLEQVINSVEFPEININDDSAPEKILQAGKTAGIFYSKSAEKYFGFGSGAYNNWEIDHSDVSDGWHRCIGIYIGDDTRYVPINGESAKAFLIGSIGLTEQGYKELCENSPSKYSEKDGNFYFMPADGGQAGWDYSYITDYEKDGDKITYNCVRVGLKDEWGYDEDLIKPFSFRLAYEDNMWKLDGVTYSEGFFYWLIGTEDDI